jgi:hypothetical protein
MVGIRYRFSLFNGGFVMETYKRESRFTELKPYDHLAKEHDFMELTEWHNGEGFDVTCGEKQFSLTHGEFSALITLVHYRG